VVEVPQLPLPVALQSAAAGAAGAQQQQLTALAAAAGSSPAYLQIQACHFLLLLLL
jgi:hypothetical protein